MTSPLARRVYDTCHLTGRFRLRSGQVSEDYFDKYLFEGQPTLLHEVAQAMVALLPECDVLAGMEMGGIPLATVMSQLTGLPTVFVRKQAKEYGTGKAAEGGPVAGRRVVLIEDVVTTGGSLLASWCASAGTRRSASIRRSALSTASRVVVRTWRPRGCSYELLSHAATWKPR